MGMKSCIEGIRKDKKTLESYRRFYKELTLTYVPEESHYMNTCLIFSQNQRRRNIREKKIPVKYEMLVSFHVSTSLPKPL